MTASRQFLDWKRPLLTEAVEFLLAHRGAPCVGVPNCLDLSGLTVVVPGSRAGRSLLSELVTALASQKRTLIPPRIVTVGGLPELLYETPELASPTLAVVLWEEALKTEADAARGIFPRDGYRALQRGSRLQQLRDTVAAGGHTFATVGKALAQAGLYSEEERWEALAVIEQRFETLLAAAGKLDRTAARQRALAAGLLPRSEESTDEVVLLGILEISPLLERFLTETPIPVTALIGAPAALAERYSAFGAVVATEWERVCAPLADQQIVRCATRAVLQQELPRWIEGLRSQFDPTEITVGLGDEGQGGILRESLLRSGLSAHWVEQRTVSESESLQLLRRILSYLEAPSIEALSALVRSPLLRRRSTNCQRALAELAREQERRLQSRWPMQMNDDGSPLVPFFAELRELCAPQLNTTPLSARGWAERLCQFLALAHGEEIVAEGEELAAAIRTFAELPLTELSRRECAELLQLIADEGALPGDAASDGVELLGWLELLLDTAPVVALCDLVEGAVPAVVTVDPFLPESARRVLGLSSNEFRYARDLAILCNLLHSRQQLAVFMPRRSFAGDSIAPSRLLYAVANDQLPQRVAVLFGEGESPAAESEQSSAGAAFKAPAPDPTVALPESLSVTAFADYLACPYRFYLRHIARIGEPVVEEQELSPLLFGNLVHAVVQELMSDSVVAQSADAAQIVAAADAILDRQFQSEFGRYPFPALPLQREQCRRRLHSFARWQAGWRAQGYLTIAQEYQIAPGLVRLPAVTGTLHSQPLGVHGRIDRIDRHSRTGEVVVIDYKSSENAKRPRAQHLKKSGWINLQLPLYRYLLEQQGAFGAVGELGYVTLPGKEPVVTFLSADWGAEEHARAIAEAARIGEAVQNREFGPINQEFRGIDPYAALLGIGQFLEDGEPQIVVGGEE